MPCVEGNKQQEDSAYCQQKQHAALVDAPSRWRPATSSATFEAKQCHRVLFEKQIDDRCRRSKLRG